jgi:transcription elongation factor Elf1
MEIFMQTQLKRRPGRSVHRPGRDPAPIVPLAFCCPTCFSDAVAVAASGAGTAENGCVLARCGECGTWRKCVMTDVVAERFEQHVAAGIAVIRQCADGLDHANVAT